MVDVAVVGVRGARCCRCRWCGAGAGRDDAGGRRRRSEEEGGGKSSRSGKWGEQVGARASWPMAHGQGTVPFYVRTRQAGERHHSDPNGLLHLLVPLVVQTPTPPAPAAATPPPRSRMFAHVFVLGGCARPRAVPTSSKRRNWARFELFTPCRRRRAIWFGRVGCPRSGVGDPSRAVVDEYRPSADACIGHRPPASPGHGQTAIPIISVTVPTQAPPMHAKSELEIAKARRG